VNVAQNIWEMLTKLFVVLIAIVAILGVVIWYWPVVQEDQRMREEKFALDKKIELEGRVAKKLDTQLRCFENPTLEKSLVERLARERLSYAKAGENVVHFESADGGVLR
jgi:hypothetical protein